MSGGFYQVGIRCLQWLGSFELVSRPIDHFCKVWQRHRKLGSHLRAQNFDGVIDGGANIGEFAGIVCAALPGADLICVEPHPACVKALRKEGFQVVEAALWKEPTRLRLTQPTSASTSSTVIADHGPAERVWEVAGMRLDSLPISGSLCKGRNSKRSKEWVNSGTGAQAYCSKYRSELTGHTSG